MLMVFSQEGLLKGVMGSVSAAGMQRVDTKAGLSRSVAIIARLGSPYP
jgi:hypothetical protein